MVKLLIVGNPGTGKSTLASTLADALDTPWVEADELLWGPGWTQVSRDAFAGRLVSATVGSEWIVDGIYPEVLRLTERADLVVWLDLPLRTGLWRLLRRSVLRSLRGDEVCGGNRERLSRLLGPNSMPFYAARIHRSTRRRIAVLVSESSTPLVRLTTAGEVATWAAGVMAASGSRGTREAPAEGQPDRRSNRRTASRGDVPTR